MRYHNHVSDLPHGRAFRITVDDETLTWESDPPGNDISEAMTLYFTREGTNPPGSGKQFQVLPGGRAKLV
jgi:hypothetical protein